MFRRLVNFVGVLFCCGKTPARISQRSTRLPGNVENPPFPKPYKRIAIPKKLRNQVWLKYQGENNVGLCYCCATNITRFHAGFHCAHVKAEEKGGLTVLENLRTTCRFCNLSMGTMNLYAYIVEKQLIGPGAKNAESYFSEHPSERYDKRTNNWGKNSEKKPKKEKIEIYVS